MATEEIFLKEDEIALRPVQEEDAKKFVKILNNQAVNRNLTIGKFPILLEEEKEWIEEKREEMKENKGLSLSIILQEENEVIGECGASRLDSEKRSPLLGIFIEEEQWRNGYGEKAIALLINHLFNRFSDARKVSSAAIEHNKASIALQKKLGFQQIGTERKEIYYKDEYYDLIKFDMLKEEWQNQNSGS